MPTVNYKREANGTFTAKIRYVDNYGMHRQTTSRGHKTKSDAQKAYIKIVTPFLHNDTAKKKNYLFSEIYEEFCANYTARNRESSAIDMQSVFSRHILPYFAEKKITDITKLDIVRWQDNLQRQNYSYEFRKKIRGYLSALFSFANEFYDVENVVAKVKPPKNKEIKKEMTIWTPEQFKKFYEVLPDDVFKYAFATFFYTGLRLGELQALTWSDFDSDKGFLSVTKSLTRKVTQEDRANGIVYKITMPKNASSVSKVKLPDFLTRLLLELKEKKAPKKGDFIFSYQNTYLSEKIIRTYIQKYATLAGLPVIRIHDFRHSHASFLLCSGVPVLVVSKRLRHANPTQTLNRYAHLLPSTENLATDVCEKYTLD